jgi:phosphatidylglycerol---prolipoprotein diacylglyceryl transferase
MTLYNFILWDASPELFSIGPLTVRWYGLLFALGFLLGQQVLIRIYKQEGKSEKHVETLTIYMVIATIVGARLGHCLFYQPEHYLTHPLEILKVWEGGLASHGAAIGIFVALYLYSKKETDQNYFYVLDRIAITVALAGCLIRIGNLMNSEIIGTPTNVPVAFLFVSDAKALMEDKFSGLAKEIEFKQNKEILPYHSEYAADDDTGNINLAGIDVIIDFKKNKINAENIKPLIETMIKDTISRYNAVRENMVLPANLNISIKESGNESHQAIVKLWAIPRHPSQLYEAFSSLLLFLFLFYIYSRKKGKTPEGRIFGLFIVILFTLRFIYEFQKENQVDFESGMIESLGVNMGQLLSIPFILVGLFILLRSFKKKGEIV